LNAKSNDLECRGLYRAAAKLQLTPTGTRDEQGIAATNVAAMPLT